MKINTLISLITCLISMLLVIWQGLSSWKNGQLNSFLRHGGMWGDFLILSPLLGYIMFRFSNNWKLSEWLVAMILSTLISAILGWIWTKDPTPSSHTSGGYQTFAGWIHLVYIVPALATIMLLYFRTPVQITADLLWSVTSLLIFHMICGTHMVLGVLIKLNLLKPNITDRDYLRDQTAWITLLIASSALVLRSLAILSKH